MEYLVIQKILVDLYLNGVHQHTIDDFTLMDVRKQIAQNKLEGYSVKINPNFYKLFDKEDEIENFVVNINNNGEVDWWFPCYKINDEYDEVSVFSENLAAALRFRNEQMKLDI